MRVQKLYIDGAWQDGDGETFDVTDPWSGDRIGTAASSTAAQAGAAASAAHRALREGLAPHRRADVLTAVRDVIERRTEEFVEVLQMEAGKPVTAARGEVSRALETLRFAAEEARRLPSETVQLDAVASGAGTMAFTLPEPVGVVAAITPFNFPLNLVCHKVAPAIAAGCPVVLKPSERTPFTAGLLVEAFEEAGLPTGWLNLVTGDPATVVGTWLEHPDTAVITFTGSAAVGWAMKAASPTKRHVLELGSNTAMVVLADADLEQAVEAAIQAGFAFSGQACVSLQRLYVEKPVIEEFSSRLAAAAAELPAGNPEDPATVLGPLISPEATRRVEAWVGEAKQKGATVLAGGTVVRGVLPATLMTGVDATSPLLREEVFGPVITVVAVENLDEALTEVNSSRFGLNTAIWTSNLQHALRYAREAQAGTVLVNRSPAYRADHMPYGGVKESGQGREGVRYTIAELTQQKLVVLA